jgi:hypothetical protein
MRYKPWAVYATFSITTRKELGIYTSRENAERDRGIYRRCLPKNVAIEVVWVGEEMRR